MSSARVRTASPRAASPRIPAVDPVRPEIVRDTKETRIAVAVVAGTVLAATTMFVFPLMVSHRIRLVELLKLSVMLGIGRPLTALRCLALVALAIAFTAAFPPSLILGSALTAVAWHWSCRPAMAQVVRSSEPLATSGQPS